MISLNLIEAYSNQLNWINLIDDIQIQTLLCVIQLDSVLYDNGICRDFYHRHYRNIFRWIRIFLIHTIRMIDHQNHSNCSQNQSIMPSSIWRKSIKTKSEHLGVATL